MKNEFVLLQTDFASLHHIFENLGAEVKMKEFTHNFSIQSFLSLLSYSQLESQLNLFSIHSL